MRRHTHTVTQATSLQANPEFEQLILGDVKFMRTSVTQGLIKVFFTRGPKNYLAAHFKHAPSTSTDRRILNLEGV